MLTESLCPDIRDRNPCSELSGIGTLHEVTLQEAAAGPLLQSVRLVLF